MLRINNQTVNTTINPESGRHITAYSGDTLRFNATFDVPPSTMATAGVTVFIRTNLGGIHQRRQHLINTYGNLGTLSSIGWQDLPLLPKRGDGGNAHAHARDAHAHDAHDAHAHDAHARDAHDHAHARDAHDDARDAHARDARDARDAHNDAHNDDRDAHDNHDATTTYEATIPVSDSGNYECTLYCIDAQGETHWLSEANITVKVVPSYYSSYNAVYSLTPRVFGSSGSGNPLTDDQRQTLASLDLEGRGYTVVQPSGTFQDTHKHIDYIIDYLKFNIIMFLPIFPVPVVYGRMGEYGSYYAPQDYFAVDPAYATFSKQQTPVQQFVDLVTHIHGKGGRVLLDLPANHTSWASSAHNRYPQWFERKEDGNFKSPGAWGVEWADLVELQYSKTNKLTQQKSQYSTYYTPEDDGSTPTNNYGTTPSGSSCSSRFDDLNIELMEYMAEVFLFWCKTGVDGFRCDAGYMIDKRIWAYIIARVRTTYPNALFLLEGLGGSWEDTYALLKEAHMDWAYSEIFQIYSADQINQYMQNTNEYLSTGGMLLNFAETHDNNRLAAQSHEYALFRVRLCALLSSNGSYGIHSGVEWFATEKFDVHKSTSIGWGNTPNMTRELSQLNTLLATHPCFTPHSQTKNIASPQSNTSETLAYIKYFEPNQGVLHHSGNKGELQPPIIYANKHTPLIILGNTSHNTATVTFTPSLHLPRKLHVGEGGVGIFTGSADPLTGVVDLLTGTTYNLTLVTPQGDAHPTFTLELPPLTILCLSESKTQLQQLKQLQLNTGIHKTIMEYQMRLELYHHIVKGVENMQANETLYHLFYTNLREFFCKLRQTPIAPMIMVNLNKANLNHDNHDNHDNHEHKGEAQYNRNHEQRRIVVPASYYLVITHNLPFYVQEFRGGNTFATKLNDETYACIIPHNNNLERKHYRSYHIAMLLGSNADNADNGSNSNNNGSVSVNANANVSSPTTTLHCVFLSNDPTEGANLTHHTQTDSLKSNHLIDPLGVCTNEMGGYAQVRGSWGEYNSKYDALLAANCNPLYPVDRTVILSKMDIWLRINNYSSPLNKSVQRSFTPTVTNQLSWVFAPHMGEYGTIPVQVDVVFSTTANQVTISTKILEATPKLEAYMAEGNCRLNLILRPFIDRRTNHHQHPEINPDEMQNHFEHNSNSFTFYATNDYTATVSSQRATFHHAVETNHNIYTPQDHSRNLGEHITLHSPGFFDLNLAKHTEGSITCYATQDKRRLDPALLQHSHANMTAPQGSQSSNTPEKQGELLPTPDNNPNNVCNLEMLLRHSSWRFLAKRDDGYTVIAGFPWFLDWGRDTLICLRGYIAGGFMHEARQVIHTFAKFELNGTLPNMIAGSNSDNRETSDAPLLFALAVWEYTQKAGGDGILGETVSKAGGATPTTIANVVLSIVEGYIRGTQVGVYMDESTNLIYSPSHYTWMDTNYPAGTPRQGFPIEIQALWAFALNFAHTITNNNRYKTMHQHVTTSIDKLFFMETKGYYSDCIHAHNGQPATEGVADDALRPNQLYLISLGVIQSTKAHRVVEQCWDLVVEGGIRSLSNRQLDVPQYIYSKGGERIDNLHNTYRGQYAGDEDTQRKLAYHNGTVWTFMFPLFIESVLTLGERNHQGVHNHQDACLSMVISMVKPHSKGALGFMDEVKDGDTPHYTRGTYAQAWSSTEALRVFMKIVEG